MYRYTCEKYLALRLKRFREGDSKVDQKWNYIHTLGTWSYGEIVVISTYLEDFVFCSPKKLTMVPIRGIFLPVSMFNEDILQ